MQVERSSNPALFFSKAEKLRIIQAVQEAETKTSGEIRVHLERKAREPFFERAKEVFERIGMTNTQERNGVLIFIGLASRRFAILGDRGIHEKAPEHFWDTLAGLMQDAFQEDRFADGIVAAVTAAGEQLQQYFPYAPDDVNELSDEISFSD